MPRALGVVALLILAIGGAGNVLARPAIAPVAIATPFPGEVAFEVVGRTDYRGDSLAAYGYLSAVHGLEPASPFVDPAAPSEVTARFAYAGELSASVRTVSDALAVVSAEGELTLSLLEGAGASFDDPESFSGGVPIATLDVRLEDVVQVEGTDALVAGEAELTQTSAEPFALDGEEFRFGHVGLEERLLVTGTGTIDDPATATGTVSVAGQAVVTRRIDPTPAPPASPTAAPVAGCEGVAEWLAAASARLERRSAIAALVDEATIDAVDAAQLRELAAEFGEIAAAQRDEDVPDAASAANRLLVTVFSTDARGLTLLVAAASAQDEAAFEPGRAVLRDGNDLAARASEQLTGLAADCDIG